PPRRAEARPERPPGRLDELREAAQPLGAEPLERATRAAVLDEHFCAAHADVERPVEEALHGRRREDALARLLRRADRVADEHRVALREGGVGLAVRVAGPPDADRLEEARVAQLLEAERRVEGVRLLQRVRLDAPNEVGLRLFQDAR
ncbi:unnamed protein product, partial [Pelagomonas calceolata]